jgi:hypothetical protein
MHRTCWPAPTSLQSATPGLTSGLPRVVAGRRTRNTLYMGLYGRAFTARFSEAGRAASRVRFPNRTLCYPAIDDSVTRDAVTCAPVLRYAPVTYPEM